MVSGEPTPRDVSVATESPSPLPLLLLLLPHGSFSQLLATLPNFAMPLVLALPHQGTVPTTCCSPTGKAFVLSPSSALLGPVPLVPTTVSAGRHTPEGLEPSAVVVITGGVVNGTEETALHGSVVDARRVTAPGGTRTGGAMRGGAGGMPAGRSEHDAAV